jgi:hypothetical protein
MHEHQALIRERVAIRVGQVALCCGANVCEYERGCGFGSDAREVDAVPRGNGRREDAWFGTERGRCVVSDTEAVAIVWSPAVLQDVSRVRIGGATAE